MRIAAILTCFNRCEKTRKCLESLYSILPHCETYITDDGSTDGTAQMLRNNFPQVHIVQGNGNLFWSRGMYSAWKEAIKGEYDYYLWLNDDIELYPFFFKELMDCLNLLGERCIITGLIGNFDKTKVLYGGTDPQKILLKESINPQEVKFMNGNVVLVPNCVVKEIGIIDPVFHHDLGDVDYGLTAQEHGIKVYTTRKVIAAGYENNFCRVRKWGVTIKQRLKRLNSPLGSPPKINFYFRNKHFGICNALVYFIYLYFINIMSDRIITAMFGDTYRNKDEINII